jgi:hypothetical protein
VLSLFLSSIILINSKPQQEESITYIILGEGNHASFRDTKPSISVFTDQNEFEGFYKTMHKSRVPKAEPPAVDFTNSLILFLSHGEKRTSGYTIEIRRIYSRGTALVVKAVLRSPPEDSFTAQVITHPYLLIQIKVNGFTRVELVDETGEVLDYKNL